MTADEKKMYEMLQENREQLVDRGIKLQTAIDVAITLINEGLASGRPQLIKAAVDLLTMERDR